jgi:purine catabolism regulator
VVGVGPPADSTTGYEESFLLAGKAADALRAQQREGVLSLAERGLDQLIIESTDAGRLVGLVDETLEPLRRHDQERRSDLIHTLELAFEHGWNLQAAARAAHVHVSTLRYRLTKVEQLSGVDLTCPDDRLTVQLSIRLSKLLGCDSADRRTAAVTSSSTSSVAARTTDELQLD